MGIESTHPHYDARLDDWVLLEDSYEGERRVKDRGETYLPPTSAMRAAGFGQNTGLGAVSEGQAAYDAYRVRAVFPDFFRRAVAGLVGVVHRKPPVVEVPEALEPVVESITVDGESLELLWRRITAAQLLQGRCGLLVDVPDGELVDEAMPYVALYSARAVRNWDAGAPQRGHRTLQYVSLDETRSERQSDFSWQEKVMYRALALAGVTVEIPEVPDGAYVTAVLEAGQDVASAEWVVPSLGGGFLDHVPFVFVNPNDLVPEPDVPPLLGLAQLCMAIYRGEADYRQGLHLQSQDTLVRIGGDRDDRDVGLGAGAVIDIPAGGDAKFIGVSPTGLPEQRSALENDRKQAEESLAQAFDAGGPDQSGEALRIRMAARTATLVSIQHAAAAAIREVLVHCGHFMGLADEALEGIVVEPNLDFSDAKIDTASVKSLMDAKSGGLPLSKESIHAWLRENEYTELDFEEEMKKILAEGESEEDDEPAAEATTAGGMTPAGTEE